MIGLPCGEEAVFIEYRNVTAGQTDRINIVRQHTNVDWLLVINTLSSSPVKNKHHRLPATSVKNLPRFVAAECIALGSRTVHSKRWNQILAENCLPHSTSPCEYCYAVWCRKTRMEWLPEGQIILKICLFVLTEFTNVTDRRTYRHRMTA